MKTARILLAIALTLAAGVIPTASPQPPVTVTPVHAFAMSLRARGPLVEAPDGRLFGIMESGGAGDNGAVFQLAPDGSGGFTFSLLYVFGGVDGRKPVGLTYSTFDDKLYGATEGGGVNGPLFDDMGTLFSLTPPAPGKPVIFTPLADLNSGGPIEQPLAPAAGLLEASDGHFYGAAAGASMAPNRGSIYKIDRAGNLEVLHLFTGPDGASPRSDLVEGSDGFLYGTTASGGVDEAGTVFKIRKDGTGFAMLHEFTGDPETQPRGLLLDTSGGSDVFYGLTGGGGVNNRGMIFRFGPSGPVTRIANFASPNGEFPTGALVKSDNGLFYGTVEAGTPGILGGVFSFDGRDISLVYDSNTDFSLGIQAGPGLLRAADGTLLGMTFNGGAHRVGTVFRMDVTDPASPPFVSKVVDFPSLGPAFPQDRMIRASDGHLYGTTMTGGDFNCGTVFRLENGAVRPIHSFDFINGFVPSGELVEGTDGSLYGTTVFGGNVSAGGNGGGLIYKISLSTEAFSVVKVFTDYAVEGAHPLAGLVEGPDGNFYGTTHQNGPGGAGTIFKVTPSGVLTTLHSFNVWSATRGTLVIGHDGYFYGVTREGGSNPLGGTIYKINSAGHFVQLHEFTDFADGAHPNALILGTDGNFYGTTEHGGTTHFGTLFRMTPGGALTVLRRFDRAVDGQAPTAPPLEAGDGSLYGSTRFGGSTGSVFPGFGTLYRYDAGGLAPVYTFGTTGGPAVGDPFAGLTQGSDNHLYGSTQFPVSGTLYQFDAGITNKAPAARSQRVTIVPGGTANVIVDAVDPDGDPVTYLIVDQPDNGTLSGTGPGFSYQPNPGFTGVDAFRVRVNDGTVSSPVAAVLITVGGANTAPTAVPGGPYIGDVGAPIGFDGNGSGDPDAGDSIASYAWTVNGTIPLTGVAPTLTIAQVAALGAGTFPVALTVTDTHGSTHSASTTVTIRVPTASFTAAPNPAACGQAVGFDGTASNNRSGRSITGYQWFFGDGAVASGATASHTYAAFGAYTTTLTVTDDLGVTATRSTVIDVNQGNLPPVPHAGGPYLAHPAAAVTFDGSGSSDPNTACGDSIVSYAWLVNGTIALSGITPTLSAAQTASLGQGTFTVQLTVTDQFGTAASVATTLTIGGPIASFTAAPNPAACGQVITFDGTASSNTTPDRTIVSYAWDFGDTTSGTGATATHAYSSFGTFTASLTVTDDLGTTASTTRTIDVNQGNRPPVANAGGPYFVYPGAEGPPVTLNGSGSSDPDAACGDSIVSYTWQIGSVPVLTGQSPTIGALLLFALGNQGTHPVVLTVVDEAGNTATATTTLTIGGPVASFTVAPNPAACNQTLTFDGTASNSTRPDRTIVGHAWTFGDGSPAGAGAAVTHAYASYGSYNVVLVVTDNLGINATTSTTVRIDQGNLPPIANPSGPYTTPVATGITLDGSGSSDPNSACGDSIVFYSWLVNGTIGLGGVSPQLTIAQIISLGPGTFPVQLTVTDEFGVSATASTSLTIQSIATSTSLQVTPTTVGALQPVTLTATVTATSGGNPPSGNVEFLIGTAVFGTAAVQNGVAVLNTNASAIGGAFPIVARYTGSAPFAASDSAPVTLTVRPLAESTYTYLVPWTTSQALGTSLTASAVVLNIGGGAAPAGSVQFFDGASLVATQALSGVVATATWTPGAAGTRQITARYVPSGTLAPSTSHPALVTVYTGAAPASTTTTLTSPASATFGQPVTFTATLSNNVPAGGVVTFYVDGAELGSALVTNVGGVKRATLTTSALPFGLRIVSASYHGAPGFAASNSALMTIVINP